MRAPAAFAPLVHKPFRLFWIAQLVASLGTWMQNTAAGWLMTDLSATPTMVALVQTAALLPVFVLAPLAGALADMVDNRRLLVGNSVFLLLAAALLALLTWLDLTSAWGLVGLTFAFGIGTAMIGPSWQALVVDLVPRSALAGAIALNGIAFNGSRAVGPALAGIVVGVIGTAACFGANAASYLVVVAVLMMLPRAREPMPSGGLAVALRDGFRFARASVALKTVLARDLGYFAAAAPVFALLPLVARESLGAGPEGYGLLLAGMGVGAVTAGFLMPSFRMKASPDRLLMLATIGTTVALAGLAIAPNVPAGMAATFIFGFTWLIGNAQLQFVLQTSLPTWVRARAISFHQMALNGALAGAGLLWGLAGEFLGVRATLAAGAAVALATVILGRLSPLRAAPQAEAEMAPAAAAGTAQPPDAAMLMAGTIGAVFVTSAWVVPIANRLKFMALMEEVGRQRRAAGAFTWTLAEDISAPEHWIEAWGAESFDDHGRIIARTTLALATLLEQAGALAEGPPLSRVWVAPEGRKRIEA
jgi:MFS family permease